MNLHEITQRTSGTGDEILDFIRMSAELGMQPYEDIKEVTIEKLPPVIKDKLQYQVYIKACYYNTLQAMKLFKSKSDLRYILGYWHGVLPVEHCFLKVGDSYYDPTGEILFPDDEHRHFTQVELTMQDVRSCTRWLNSRRGPGFLVGACDWYNYQRSLNGRES